MLTNSDVKRTYPYQVEIDERELINPTSLFPNNKFSVFTDNMYEFRRMGNLEKTLNDYQKRGLVPASVEYLLNVGCGTCIECPTLKQLFSPKYLMGIDWMRECAKRALYFGRISDYVVTDARYLSSLFSTNFELVTVFGQEFRDNKKVWEDVMREIPNALKKDGTVILTFHEEYSIDEPVIPSITQMRERINLLKKGGVKEVDFEANNNPTYRYEGVNDLESYVYYDKFIFIGRK